MAPLTGGSMTRPFASVAPMALNAQPWMFLYSAAAVA